MFEIILIIISFILAALFPAFLIDAIRAEDEKIADDKRTKACVTFGFLVTTIVYCFFM